MSAYVVCDKGEMMKTFLIQLVVTGLLLVLNANGVLAEEVIRLSLIHI